MNVKMLLSDARNSKSSSLLPWKHFFLLTGERVEKKIV